MSTFLEGDGKGDFEVVSPTASGIIQAGDNKSLVLADLTGSGRPGLTFGINDTDATFLENRPTDESGSQWLNVQLRGTAGNPTAIGARVSLELGNMPKQTIEIRAGGGYLSQAPPHAWLGLGSKIQGGPAVLRVRWPDDGSESRHLLEVLPPSRRLVLSKPRR